MHWSPNGTGRTPRTRISELRLIVEYESLRGAARTLTLDIVDYPGEWLLDLPLLTKSYEQWAAESLALSRQAPRAQLAEQWHVIGRRLTRAGPKTNRRRSPPPGYSPLTSRLAGTSAMR